MVLIRPFLLFVIAHCCALYGSNPDRCNRLSVPYAATPLLSIALKRAIEKAGFDTIWHAVQDIRYRHWTIAYNYVGVLPYAFLWNEQIDPSDQSPTAQLLFRTLAEKGEWRNNGLIRVVSEENNVAFFTNDNLFRVYVHDHRKNEILAMLEELRLPLETKIINSILTNSNTDPL